VQSAGADIDQIAQLQQDPDALFPTVINTRQPIGYSQRLKRLCALGNTLFWAQVTLLQLIPQLNQLFIT
jgi:hypothetical protein